MKQLFQRFFGRIFILAVGGLAVWFTVFKVLDYIEEKLPLAFALFLTYILAAYIIFPFALRIIRLIFKPNHIPRYASTPDGFPCDPINVGIVGTKQMLIETMQEAGWYVADKKTLRTSTKLLFSFFFKKPYPNAPFSTLFLFGRPQDIGFEMPDKNSVTKRHHVRFWACIHNGEPKFIEHVNFWNKHYMAAHSAERYLWVGAATRDMGLAIIRHNLQVTHAIEEDTNKERDFVIETLKNTRRIHNIRVVQAGPSHERKNRGIGVVMKVDGEMHIAELNQPPKKSVSKKNQ